MRIGILWAASLLALAGCGPVATVPAGSMAAMAQAGDWTKFRDNFVNRWFELDPANAVYQGKHEFDGQLPDWSAAGLKKQGDFLKETIAAAAKFDATKLSDADRFERDYLVKVAQGKLFWLEDADQPHHNPTYYVGGGLDPNVYIARPYADAPTRMKAMIKFFNSVTAQAPNIRANLKTRCR